MNNVIFLKALSDKTRLKIVELLLGGERCVCDIVPNLSVKQSTTSIHLKKLEEAGLIKSRREGKKVYYHISDERVIGVLRALGIKKAVNNHQCCID